MANTTLTVAAASCTLSGTPQVTATSGTASATGARSADFESGGLYYFECTATTVGSASDAIGFINQSGSLTSSTSTNKLQWARGGAVAANGTTIGTAAAFASGNLLCFAIDLDLQQIWVRVGAAGNWNNSATADPVARLGGFSWSAHPVGPIAPMCQFNSNGDAATFNFGASAFTGSVPSGYTSGWPTAATEMVASELGIEEWEQPAPALDVSELGIELWRTVTSTTTLDVSELGAEVWVTVSRPIAPLLRPWLREHFDDGDVDPEPWLPLRRLAFIPGPRPAPALSWRCPLFSAAEEGDGIEWLPIGHARGPSVRRGGRLRPYLSINA
ncbi:MAG TPA: hypothetical protein VGR45_17300 [Stellaceae bacterium]|nr:hypothetical protein [Stellaceae bacterium]